MPTPVAASRSSARFRRWESSDAEERSRLARKSSGGKHARIERARTCALATCLLPARVSPPFDFRLSRVHFLASSWDARAARSPVTYATVGAFHAAARQSGRCEGCGGSSMETSE